MIRARYTPLKIKKKKKKNHMVTRLHISDFQKNE